MLTQFHEFLKRKGLALSWQVYGIDVLSALAMGLFSSLLVGTILNSIGQIFNIPFLSETVWPMAQAMTGPAIGIAIAKTLNAPALILYSSVIVGYAGNDLAGPVGAWLAVWLATEVSKIVSKETPLDLILTPAVNIITGVALATLIGPPIQAMMIGLGEFVMEATYLQPIWMGMVVSVVVGAILTLPISSAALCIMISLGGLAGGAATAGCCAQMVGFAVMSYPENGMKGLLAQGLGTSMLQVPNIIRNWKIWLPPTLASLITGPLATTVFRMDNLPLGSGMGTSGLVGQMMTLQAMSGESPLRVWTGILLLHFILPALLTWIFAQFMRQRGWIQAGDLKLDF